MSFCKETNTYGKKVLGPKTDHYIEKKHYLDTI